MSVEATDLGILLVIGVMACVTLLTRFGGVLIMSYVTISPRVKRFIQAMSSSVLIAVVTPILVTGDHSSRLGLAVTGMTMLWLKRPMLAIAAGVISTALARYALAS